MQKSFALLLAGALLLVGCSDGVQPSPDAAQATQEPAVPPTPEPVYSYDTETVRITTEDGLGLAGTFFKTEGEVAVLFIHMSGPNDQKNWIPFANNVAKRGFSALTVDLRCFGESDCRGGTEPGWVTTTWDLQAALEFLRARGLQNIVCAGASMGGRACLTVAFDEELAGLIILSGTASADPDKQDLNKILNPGMPKLFIVAERDPTVNITADMTGLYESAPEPKAFHAFPGEAHGTGFFRSQYGSEVGRLIYDLLYGIRDTIQAPAP